ncbi:MAG TPA: TIGR04222 domain-containing membrane protein, partial [Micromonospora sp.]
MQILAAEGDTWGIPGPTFLAAFVWLALLVVVGSMIYRAFLFAGRGGRETLHPQQAGFVNGGPPLAVYTSLAALRSAGAVGATSGGALAQAGPPPMHATPLDHAVYAAAGRSVSTRSLVDDPGVAAALAQLRHGLEEKGLL